MTIQNIKVRNSERKQSIHALISNLLVKYVSTIRFLINWIKEVTNGKCMNKYTYAHIFISFSEFSNVLKKNKSYVFHNVYKMSKNITVPMSLTPYCIGMHMQQLLINLS